ncbi:MAG: hypothetical protein OXF33_08040 [Rhodospirillales bacterium]|nr:hypothetical protein [Rhodospirillales bacterium]
MAATVVPTGPIAWLDVFAPPALRLIVQTSFFPEQFAGVVVGHGKPEAVLVTLKASAPLSPEVETILKRGNIDAWFLLACRHEICGRWKDLPNA